MIRCFLKAKIHNATITDAHLQYEGSLSIDEEIIKAAGLLPFEKIIVSNLNNGERFETYIIPASSGSGSICLNGPTARQGLIGDKIIILSFCYLTEDEITKGVKPVIIKLNDKNKL